MSPSFPRRCTALLLISLAASVPSSKAADPATATKQSPFTNSLGMKFVPVPGTEVLFCVWKTRVRDFEAFVKETGYDATGGMYSLRSDRWSRGDNWHSPGFEQTPEHPVCGVNWDDAQAFCRWISQKEGRMYRLPMDAEWSLAVGSTKYPWGDKFPPPPGAGNYAGEEARDGNWPSKVGVIAGYRDGFARTSPVGSFAANRAGLYDLGGNLWEWCEDFYFKEMNSEEMRSKYPELNYDGGGHKFHALRGGSWYGHDPTQLLSSWRRNNFGAPEFRVDFYGFRVVLVGSPS